MSQEEGEEKRAFFRLRYPIAERPVLRIADSLIEVNEISEGGVELLIDGWESVFVGDSITGELRFANGELLAITGEVMRRDSEGVIVKLSDGISMKQMIAEQLRLRRKYPDVNGA